MPTILVVDDHAFIRRGVRSILEPFPEWELCGEAENGQEAIQKASELHPAIVIMDVSMPILDGIAATQAIKKSYPQMHVILLTLHSSRELLSRAFQAGARGYVLKADVDDELLKALRIVTGDGSYISPKIDETSARAVVREITSNPHLKEKP
ncbi:MAG TPA: response regulator transcription factor [Candidatus Saccharimonadales bacterium]|nr:response regulator transcription factor [Candidatus Saccharimonadales bacterium]